MMESRLLQMVSRIFSFCRRLREYARRRPRHINFWSRRALLALPVRAWDKPRTYNSLLVVPLYRREHDSGWGMMAVIGVIHGEPVEIAAWECDDIEWINRAPEKYYRPDIRMDCAVRSGALQVWHRELRFRVGAALSKVEIEIMEGAPDGCASNYD